MCVFLCFFFGSLNQLWDGKKRKRRNFCFFIFFKFLIFLKLNFFINFLRGKNGIVDLFSKEKRTKKGNFKMKLQKMKGKKRKEKNRFCFCGNFGKTQFIFMVKISRICHS